jgi:hypothetical protein
MKIDRKSVSWFLRQIRRTNTAEEKQLTDDELVDKLCAYMEYNPACIRPGDPCESGKFYYRTVGYGVMSLMGEFYRMGRIEIYDKEDDSGYAVDEGTYCMPFTVASQFEDFIESIETDLPIQIDIGSVDICQVAVSTKINIPVEKLNDNETIRKYVNSKVDNAIF